MAPTDTNDNMARLVSKANPSESVVFQFNPAAISISHTAPMQPAGGRGQHQEGGAGGGASGAGGGASGGTNSGAGTTTALTSVDEVAKANGVTSITVNSVTFDGANVADICERLLDWTKPGDVNQSTQKQDLPELKFVWGKIYPVNLNQVSINYTRFARNGLPVRATVNLTLHSIPGPLTTTNPTSGGLSGRRTHLVTGAETLPELSTRTYGSPGRWREIAAANGIADPLRVRPGTLVYLPSAQEGD